MPVYLFTYHAYRSWQPSDPRGFVQEGQGVQQPNDELARAYDDAADQPAVQFDHTLQAHLIEIAYDVCSRRQWQLHGAATEPTHLHVLVSWADESEWSHVRGKIRNIISTELAKRYASPGRKWFSQGASRKRVRNKDHFDYLMGTYLPKHGGRQWYEGQPSPPGGG